MENKLSGHIKSFSIPIMFVQIHYGSFYRIVDEFYNFAVIIDSFQMSFLAPYILNTPCKIENYEHKKTFLLMTYIIKRHVLRLRPLVILLLTKTLIIY